MAPSKFICSACGSEFFGRSKRLLCFAQRCKDRRYQRLHRDAYLEGQRRKQRRRRERKP